MGKDVIIALDFDSREKTLAFLDQFTDRKPFVKIGMELFYAEGPSIAREIKARGHKIFLDLKLHDIPNTVKKAMAVLSALDVDMVNLHAAVEVQPAQFPVDKNALFTHDNSFFPRRSPLSAHIGEALPFVYHILRNARHLCHLIEALEPAMGKTIFQNGSRFLLPEAGQCGHSVHPGGVEVHTEGLPQRLDHR